jgi:DNA polymerase elongation subunit (family B)
MLNVRYLIRGRSTRMPRGGRALHVKGMITERRDQPLLAREVVRIVLEKALVCGARKQDHTRIHTSNKVEAQRLAATCKYSKPWYEYTETRPVPVCLHARSQSRHHSTNGAVITRTILHPPLQST